MELIHIEINYIHSWPKIIDWSIELSKFDEYNMEDIVNIWVA